RRNELVGQLRVLGVDLEDPVGTDEHADGAAGSLEGVEVVGQLRGLDLNLAEILLRRRGGSGRRLGERRHRQQSRRQREDMKRIQSAHPNHLAEYRRDSTSRPAAGRTISLTSAAESPEGTAS